MRRKNPKMKDNDDQALGDEFEDRLAQIITSLPEELQQVSKPNQALERGIAVIKGRKDLIKLLVDKTDQYLQCCDPDCQIVV